jgi:hypothetical protein
MGESGDLTDTQCSPTVAHFVKSLEESLADLNGPIACSIMPLWLSFDD